MRDGGLQQHLPEDAISDVLHISTASQPLLHGIKTAISGESVLIHNVLIRVRLNVPDSQSYQVATMLEQHPRAAIGWNEESLFLVEVDGRQKHLSIGMTLDEFSKWLMKLGCEEAMNFDRELARRHSGLTTRCETARVTGWNGRSRTAS